ncbi:MAG TPA: alanine racemase [Segeticoccus sp.]|uniref:alanine racemase n=1 Tax=Segeticoccus sp. TaxID=2706531 RepID=UPI002D7E5902|nr:alanine racemase [Segeticoccus sp.]HET8599418.1 alanine racemase [Segeticoccus sp.]
MTTDPTTETTHAAQETGRAGTRVDTATARVQVDLDAIRANVAELDRRAGDANVLAVVKADAYGHGLVPCARAAIAGGATWLGTAQLGEALALRAAGISAPLLTWLTVPGSDFAAAVNEDVDLSASAPWGLAAIAEGARRVGKPARVHLCVDSGLGREGAYGQGWTELVGAALRHQAEGHLRVVGIWSHFAYADAPQHPTVQRQQERFEEAVAEAERAGIRPEVRHLANSAAVLTNPSAAYDLVRPGLAVYGLSPVPDVGAPAAFGLTPAMTLEADVALVKRVPAGQGVSYGHTYVTSEPTTLALVPMGYGDGIPRAAGNAGPVLIGGQRRTVSGRVCMDQFTVDVGAEVRVSAGDRVVLFGPGTSGEPTAQDWAAAVDTISYEIVTRVGARVPRVYAGSVAP